MLDDAFPFFPGRDAFSRWMMLAGWLAEKKRGFPANPEGASDEWQCTGDGPD